MSTTRRRLASMRTRTFDFFPYLATYIYSMRPREKPGLGTLAVDVHGNMYYDPHWIDAHGVDEGAYGVVHEVCHIVFRHHERACEMYGNSPTPDQQHVCNVAADLVVEQTLHSMRQFRPAGSVHLGMEYKRLGITLDFPPDLRMEEYYRLIMEKLQQKQEEQKEEPDEQKDEGDDGEPQSGDGGDDQQGGGDAGDTGEQQSPGSGDPQAGGSAADGVPRDYEVEPDGSWEAFGEDAASAATEKAMQDYEDKHAGAIPAGLRHAISTRSKVVRDPWGELKAAVATSVSAPVGGRDCTYRRASRRQPPNMMRLRGWQYTQPSAVVVLDTSGSMCNPDDQAKALTCIAAGLRKLTRFKVVAGDVAIASRKDVSSIAQVEWAGGGGTDMGRIVTDVDRTDRPDSIVLVTDGYTPWPTRPTRARLVVACTTNSESVLSRIPRWARTVVLAD